MDGESPVQTVGASCLDDRDVSQSGGFGEALIRLGLVAARQDRARGLLECMSEHGHR